MAEAWWSVESRHRVIERRVEALTLISPVGRYEH
jgi:hypothetical protein